MTPGSSIGSAEPKVIGLEEEIKDEKTISALRAKFKAIAERNGHNIKLAEAFVDKDLELKFVEIEGKKFILTPEELEIKNKELGEKSIKVIKTITEKGKLLSLTAEEAREFGLVKEVLPNRKALLNILNLKEAKIVEPKPTWSENLVRFLTHPIVSSFLLTLGFLGIIYELKAPGWGLAGTLGVISLALFFWGHHLVGLANWTEILLFIISIILIGLEIFVIPGFGIIGISGGFLLLISIFLALIKHPLHIPKKELFQAAQILAYSLLVSFIMILASLKFFPRSKFWKRLVLLEEETPEKGYKTFDLTPENLVGKLGKTISPLRPAGKAEFFGKILDVISEGDFIEEGKEIKIIRVEGNKIIVGSV